MPRTPDQIRKNELTAPTFDAVRVGRIAGGAASADLATAWRLAREHAEAPRYFAKYRDHEVLVTEDEYLALKAAGAKENAS